MSTDPISVPQQGFIRSLLSERNPDEHTRREAEGIIAAGNRQEAKGIIDRLKNAPKVAGRREGNGRNGGLRVIEPGVYRHDGEVYIVKPTRDTAKAENPADRRLYAKRMVEIGGTRVTETGEYVNVEFEFAPGAVYKLDPSDKMPFEEAKALTARYGRCIVCGRSLKDAKSVEAGIGPVCRTYFGPMPVVFDSPEAHAEAMASEEAVELPAGSPGSRHPFTPGELAEMNERSTGQRTGAAGGIYGPDGYMIAGAVDALDR